MKTYQIQIAVLGGDNQTVWNNRGVIRGRSKLAILRRAWGSVFNSPFEGRRIADDTVFHRKYPEMPCLRIVEIAAKII